MTTSHLHPFHASPGDLLDRLRAIAEAAGAVILKVYEAADAPAVTRKADDSPVTVADRRADALIRAQLSALDLGWPVVSEEAAPVDPDQRLGWLQHWLVDPLDGTREFLNRNPDFTVNIALVVQGMARLGVVHVPATGVTYGGWTGADGGAWRWTPGAPRVAIRTRPAPPPAEPLVVLVSRNHAGDALAPRLERLRSHYPQLTVGSRGSALKLCLVAEGVADLYPRLTPTCEWDTAAAHAVLAAAGGELWDLRGRPLRYNQRRDLLNPGFIAVGDARVPWLDLW